MAIIDEEVDPYAKYLVEPVVKPVAPSSSVTFGMPGTQTLSPKTSKIDIEGLNSDLKERLELLRADWMSNKELNPKGEDLPVTSGRRTREEQYNLFRARIAGAKNTGFMAVDPGTQPGKEYFHENAFDILPKVPDTLLQKYGLHRPFGARDPVHVEINPKAEFIKPVSGQPILNSLTNNEGIDPYEKYLAEKGILAPTVTEEVKSQFKDIKQGTVNQLEALKNDLMNPEFYTKTLPKQAAALADTLYGVVPGAVQFVGTPFAKLADMVGGTTKATELLAKTTELAGQPFGKAFGITNDPAYNAEASQRIMAYIGKNMEKGAEAVAKETGLSKADVEWFMNAALIGATPMVARGVKKGVEVGTDTLQSTFDAMKSKREPSGRDFETPGSDLKRNASELQQRYELERQAAMQPREGTVTLEEPGAKQTIVEPIVAERGSAKPTTPDAPFTEVKYAENGLPLDEQYARAQTLNRVLGSDHRADLAAIEGKGKERATNYAVSNTDTPMGGLYKEKFAEEQKLLAKFAERQVKNTGGTVGLDESTLYKRGNTLLKPLDSLKTALDKETKKIYTERDAIAKDIPVESKNILKILDDESINQANSETIGLEKQTRARMKQLKMIDKDGNILPTNAKTAENLRQFLNENWDHKNANLHRKLKEAVDEDVLANLDTNTSIYKDARSLVEFRKNTLDNPNGISKILDSEGPNGINRKVPIEKIAQNIADMPVDQITHIIDTYKNVPEGIKAEANAALSEMKAQFANNLASKKTPKQVTDYMNANSEVMNRLFTPEEMNNFRDYHNAVHILATDTGYKGAAVQKINVEQKLGSKVKEHLITKGGAVAAETVTSGVGMGVPALLTHEYLSGRAATKRSIAEAKAEAKALEDAQKRFVNISDLIK
jgi:hypothetical protein